MDTLYKEYNKTGYIYLSPRLIIHSGFLISNKYIF